MQKRASHGHATKKYFGHKKELVRAQQNSLTWNFAPIRGFAMLQQTTKRVATLTPVCVIQIAYDHL